MEKNYTIPVEEEANEEMTLQVRADPKYRNYCDWLEANGCIYPSLDFPVAFSDLGIVGCRAREDIPSMKAFLFVPYSMIITPQRARESEIGFIFSSHKLFKKDERATDFILWVYLIFERQKGPSSFFFPYFEVCPDTEILMDWSSEELSMLQDKFLVIESRKCYRRCMYYFTKVESILKKYPTFFPQASLKDLFFWAYKLVSTRAFCTGEGDIVPFADALNHHDVYIDYLRLSSSFLHEKSSLSLPNKDYGDFTGQMSDYTASMNRRTHSNRLEKLFSTTCELSFESVENIWELDFQNLESSSDEEEIVNGIELSENESEESSVEEEEVEDTCTQTQKYFVMRTGNQGSFLKGKEVFNCYGRLNNFDLLIDYGFCLLPNRYDSVYIRLYKSQMTRVNGKALIIRPDIASTDISNSMEVYYVKYNKLAEELLGYVRRLAWEHKHYDRQEIAAQVEKFVINQTYGLIIQLIEGFPTTLEEDENTLLEAVNPKEISALRYRISQKRILKEQGCLLKRLEEVIEKVKDGMSLQSAHWSDRDQGNARAMYPLRNYLKAFSRRDFWSN